MSRENDRNEGFDAPDSRGEARMDTMTDRRKLSMTNPYGQRRRMTCVTTLAVPLNAGPPYAP